MSDELLSKIGLALQSLDTEQLLTHYVDEAVFSSAVTGKMVQGKDELRAYFTRLFSLPRVSFSVSSMFSSLDMAAIEWTWSGVSARSQTPFRIQGVSILQHRGNKIIRETIYYDPTASIA